MSRKAASSAATLAHQGARYVFGSYRYLLALLVVVAHLGPGGITGLYAVFGFYVLSGYLMTLSLNRVYGFSPTGVGRFFVNRWLRIFVPYYPVLLMSMLLVMLLPNDAVTLSPALFLQADAGNWASNLLVVGLAFADFSGPHMTARLIPPAWSLGVELVLYALMAAGLSRNRWTAVVWFAVAVSYHAFWAADMAARYYPVQAALLPFSVGALIYHFNARLPAWHAPIAVALFVANMVASSTLPFWRTDWWGEFYLSLAFASYITVSLRNAQLAPRLARVDRFLGALAYPMFLCHWPTAIPLWSWLGRPDGYGLLLASLAPVHGVAFIVHHFVERPVERLRHIIRARSTLVSLWPIARARVSEST